MKSLLGSTAIYLLLPLTAFAADLPKRTAAPAAPISAPATWTGFYVGGNIGYGRDNYSMQAISGTPKVASDLDAKGIVGGFHGGYNHQFGMFVVGAEADINAAPWTKSGTSTSGKKFSESRMVGLGSLRGKLGLAFDRTMVYGTAGVGFVKSSYASSEFGLSDKTKSVAVVGGGVEYKLTSNISVGLEGLYFLDNKSTQYATPSAKKVIAVKTGNVGVVRAKVSWSF